MPRAKQTKKDAVKPAEASDRKRDAEAIAKALNRQLKLTGENALRVGDVDGGMKVPYWVKSGIPELDYAVGGKSHPGFPGGRIIEIFGVESSGKSTLALHIMKTALAQNPDMVASYQDAEKVLSNEIMRGTRLDMSRTIYSQPELLEDSLNTLLAMSEYLTDSSENSKDIRVISVLDSLAQMTTIASMKREVGESGVAEKARIMSDALPKLNNNIVRSNMLSVIVNQTREAVGVMYGDSTTTPGGQALKFAASVRLKLNKGIDEKSANGGASLGKEVKGRVVKNKMAAPNMEFSFYIKFVETKDGSYPIIDVYRSQIEWCLKNDLLQGASGRVQWDGKSYGVRQLAKIAASNPEVADKLYELSYSIGVSEQESEEPAVNSETGEVTE